MTLLALSPENSRATLDLDTSICFRDSVRLHFLFKLANHSNWQDLNYSIDAEVVAGPEPQDDNGMFQPYLLPAIPLPEGDPFGTAHPFRMNENPFTKVLPDGGHVELRYVVVQRDDLESIEALMKTA